MTLSDTYCVANPNSWRDRLILRARQKIYRKMERMLPLTEMQSVLDVGVTTDRKCGFSNFFEMMFPYPGRITAFSNQDASWMCETWPGLKFVRGDARKMPFADKSFDFVFSSAVIEHVGSRDCQRTFLSECFRVARKRIFITTPNRWFPMEMHTGLPLLHWLPMRWHRRIIRLLGFESHSLFSAWALEEGIQLGRPGEYGVGMFFLPEDEVSAENACRIFEQLASAEQIAVLGWRNVPCHPAQLGAGARSTMPRIRQCFLRRPGEAKNSQDFDRRLYVLRRVFEKQDTDTYIC